MTEVFPPLFSYIEELKLEGYAVAIRLKKMFRKTRNTAAPICSAVVAAAGSSTRMEGINKLFVEICGKPVLAHTLTALSKCREIREIIVVARETEMNEVARICGEYHIAKISRIIAGGRTRLESVYNGVMQVLPDSKLIAVHDGARPFPTERIVTAAVKAALQFSAAAPAVPLTSTIKIAKNGIVEKTIDRDSLYEVQTPQVFVAELLKGALQNAIDKSLYITDDCMALEAIGCRVKLTEGSRENIKLTAADDLLYAEVIAQKRRESL
ncbi:MAG: 2-C-methyl-D-erythritol 4-phosphate cytidylyltransferase [Clostridiales bacterium]|nr:2-C-methyl-D-erythritol 4-phosphate cytidylyltransferase [Clostridiales bacterium]